MSETNKRWLDVFLSEYQQHTKEFFESKLKTYPDSGNRYLPLDECRKMFLADNPNGTIQYRMLMDNNIFASVEAKVVSDSGKVVIAIGKWYHSNEDSFGKNYVATAQSRALSKALREHGYYYSEENEEEPSGEQNKGEIMPLPFYLDDNQEFVPILDVPNGQRQTISSAPAPIEEMSVEQAKSFIVNGALFGKGMSVGFILDSGDPKLIGELKRKFTFAIQQKTTLAPVARVILPLIKE